jgi:hypothetical protein
VGSGDLLGVEPPVIRVGEFEGEFIILQVIFPDIDIKTVGGPVMVGL